MLKDKLTRKVFSILFALGISNITLAYGLFYFTSLTLLEERAEQQMDSVRALATEKLRLYFMHLKTSVFVTSAHGVFTGITIPGELRDSLLAIYELNARPDLVFGKDVKGTERFEALPKNSIEMFGDHELVLKASCRKTDCVWVFSFLGVNEILSERAGLGKTGEIYLVGPDNWIRSASRHLPAEKSARVLNDSIRFGNENKYGVIKVKDYRNVEVLSAFSPFVFDGMNFVILSEIDRAEVIGALKSFLPSVYLVCSILLLLTLVLAFWVGRKIIALVHSRTP